MYLFIFIVMDEKSLMFSILNYADLRFKDYKNVSIMDFLH